MFQVSEDLISLYYLFLYCCLHNHKTNEQNRSYSLLPEIQDLESCVCARSHQSVQEVAFIIHLFTNETYLHFSWSWIWGLYLSKKSTEWHPSLGCNTSFHLLKFLRKTCNSHGLKLRISFKETYRWSFLSFFWLLLITGCCFSQKSVGNINLISFLDFMFGDLSILCSLHKTLEAQPLLIL